MSSNKVAKAKAKARVTKVAARRNNVFTDKRKRGLAIIIAIAMFGVGCIGYAVAALSQDLTINGTATVKGLNWDIHFANLDEAVVAGKAEEVTPPTIDSTTTKIGDYKVILNHPGDSVAYDFEVVNAGDIDAKITSVTIKTGTGLTCTSTSDKADTVCANLDYKLTYDDGSAVVVGDDLMAGATRKMNLKLELSSLMDLADMPEADVEVGGLEVVITYGQKAE